MLYYTLKIFSRLGMHLFCRDIRIKNKALLNSNGPILLAVNHPNSFLDAIIIATLFNKPIYSLARGDVFKKKTIAGLLIQLNILPVYREREGVENLHHNYATFNACNTIFKKNGIVLIFTEALCENEWHLRPLKKGTARLALTAWQQGIPVKVLPIGINYSSFKLFGKNVHINIGEFIEQQHFNEIANTDQGKMLNVITSAIKVQLQKMVYEIELKDKTKLINQFEVKPNKTKRNILTIPALMGYWFHLPLYYPLKKITQNVIKESGHYDAVLVSILGITYPFYILLIALLLKSFTNNYWWLTTFILLPFFAWSFVQLNKQIDD